MATSMRLTQHEGEGHNEELIALIVADMQDPVTPILEVTLVSEGMHDTRRVIARLSKIVHHGAAVIDENLLRIGAVKIDLGHVTTSFKWDGWHRDLSVAGVLGAVRKTEAVMP